MFFRMIYKNTGLSYLHSSDLDDMRNALLIEDDDGPDGGSPCVTETPANRNARTLPTRSAAAR